VDILDDMGVSKLSAKVFSKVNYSNHYHLIRLTISIEFGLAVWFCSGQELPAQAIMDKSMGEQQKSKQNGTNMNVLQISLIQDFKCTT